MRATVGAVVAVGLAIRVALIGLLREVDRALEPRDVRVWVRDGVRS
jgi:hypothetical protein